MGNSETRCPSMAVGGEEREERGSTALREPISPRVDMGAYGKAAECPIWLDRARVLSDIPPSLPPPPSFTFTVSSRASP